MLGNALKTGIFGKQELRELLSEVHALNERLYEVDHALAAQQMLLQGAGATDFQTAKQLGAAINKRVELLRRAIVNDEPEDAIAAIFRQELTIVADPYSSVSFGGAPEILSFQKAYTKYEKLVNGIRFVKNRTTFR